MKNKFSETGVNVCDRTIRNRLNSLSLLHWWYLYFPLHWFTAEGKFRFRISGLKGLMNWPLQSFEKKSQSVDDWMKVIFSGES